MDTLETMCHGFKFKEIVDNIDDLPALYNNGERYCTKCEMELKIIDGLFICDECGEVYDSVMVSEWVDNI